MGVNAPIEGSNPSFSVRPMTRFPTLCATAALLAAVSFPSLGSAAGMRGRIADAGPSGRWVLVSSASVVGYRARERYVGVEIPAEVVGRTSVVKGSMEIAGERIAASRVNIDMRTLRSDKPQRDDNLNTRMGPKWNLYPIGTFRLRRPIPLDGLRIGEVRKGVARGALRLRGRTRLVDVPVTLRWNGPTFEALGRLRTKMTDFGFDPPSVAGLTTVENGFSFEFRLTFRRLGS
jgi:polyisoprenoid-binding protein YceI